MPSKRLRSKKTLSAVVTNLSSSVSRVEQVSVPFEISAQAISGDALSQDAIRSDAVSLGAISSKSLGLSAYVPSGEGIQRIPAPLTDTEYWEDVVDGLIELHKSGIHDNEDIQNVSVSTSGLVFSPTGVSGGDARIYLTGRLPIPRSRTIYATWRNTATIPIKLIWWETATPVKVAKASISNGVVTFTTEGAHGFSVSTVDAVKVTGCGVDFNGVYTLTSDSGPEGETNVFTAAKNSVAPADVNETVFAIEGTAVLESRGGVFNYVELSNKVSWKAPDIAGEYAVYAELPFTSTERTLIDAKVFEVIGSGKAEIISANVNNYSITSNVITLTTANTHAFETDDIVSIGYTPEETIAASNCQVSAGSPNVLTVRFASTHKFHTGYEVSLNLSPATFNGTYTISAIPNTTAINLLTTLNTSPVTTFTGNVTAVTTPISGQAKITSTTANTFTVSRTNLQNVASTAITTSLAEVGRPRYSYITYIATSVASSYIDVYTETPHGFSVGETVTITGASPAIFPGVDGAYTISSAVDRYFRITTTPEATVGVTAITAKQALAYVGSSDFSVQVSPEGFKFIGSGDDSVDTDLGTTSDNFITLSRVDGQSLASIDNQGVGTFTSLVFNSAQAAGSDLVGSIVTDKYNDNSYGTVNYSGSLLDRMARGSVYRGYFYIPRLTSISTKFATLAYGVFTLSENRSYLLTTSFGGLRATPTANAVLELLMSTEPYQADALGPRHLTSTLAGSAYGEFTPLIGTYYTGAASVPATNVSISSISRSATTVSVTTSTAHGLVAGDYIGVSGTTNTLLHGTWIVATAPTTTTLTYVTDTSGTITSLTTGTIRKVDPLLSAAGKLPAGVPIYWLLRIRHGAAPTAYTLDFTALPDTAPQQELAIIDIGDSRAQLGVDASKVNQSSNILVLAPDSGGGAGTATYTATATVSASDSAYYDNYGKGTGTSDPYAYRYSLYQGNPGTASGTKKSAILFPTVSPPAGATNVTVTKVEVYLRNRHSYSASGLTAYIGYHGSSSLGSSVPGQPDGLTNITTSFTKGQGKWVTLSSTTHTGFKPGAQTLRGILIGITEGEGTDTYYSALSNYGYFDGNTMSDEPQLRITYTYQL